MGASTLSVWNQVHPCRGISFCNHWRRLSAGKFGKL